MLDKKNDAHIGWRLWQASHSWHREFVQAMQTAGHGWFTEARSTLLGATARKGTRQSVLVDRLGISKQAVQQLIDGLEAEGIVERIADPEDKRGRIIRLTEAGLTAMKTADSIKGEIQQAYIDRIGADDFQTLVGILDRLEKN